MSKKTGAQTHYEFTKPRVVGVGKLTADYYAEQQRKTQDRLKRPPKRKKGCPPYLTEERCLHIAAYFRKHGVSATKRDLRVSAVAMEYVQGEMALGKFGGL